MATTKIHYRGRWAVVTGASSGLGRGLAARLAERGMSLVLTGRNQARLDETAQQIRLAAPQVKVETVAADLSTPSGVSALLDHVGDRPIEVLVNNAGFGSYGPFAEADPTGRPTRWPSTSGRWSPWLALSCPECSPAAAAGFSMSRPRSRSSPRPTRRSTGRARPSCCPSARPSGPRPARPAWRSPPCVRGPPAPASSTRWVPRSATRRSTGGSPTPSPSSRPGYGRWTRARPSSFPACGPRSSRPAAGSCRASGSPWSPPDCSARPPRPPGHRSRSTTRS